VLGSDSKKVNKNNSAEIKIRVICRFTVSMKNKTLQFFFAGLCV
jgi:hypothetical protein